ncbi:metallophosphoesterase family protein [Cellulomonas soli]
MNGRIVVAGDWHGNTTWAMHVVEKTAALGMDTILHVGDLGILWPGDVDNSFTFKLQRHLDRHGVRLVLVDGNHDNHTALRALPRDAAGFGVVRTKTKGGGRLDLIRWAPRGHRWTWPGTNGRAVRFGALGGAFSIDYEHRRAGKDWWPIIEEVRPDDVGALGTDPLDVLVSHDCPTGAVPPSKMQIDHDDDLRSRTSRDRLREAVNATRPRLHFAGHWHQRRVYELDRQDGGRPTTVHVLNMDGEAGNCVVLDLGTLTVT